MPITGVTTAQTGKGEATMDSVLTGGRAWNRSRSIVTSRNIAPWLICGGVFVVMGLWNRSLFTWYSASTLLTSAAPVFLMAAGEMVVLVVGSIDLSLAASVGFTSVFAAVLLTNDQVPVALAVVATLVMGAFIGAINGLLITRGKLQSFIVTLGTMTALRGLMLIVTNGTSIPLTGQGVRFEQEFGVTLGGIPVYFYGGIVLVALLSWFLSNSRLGRHMYALGGSEDAARVSGLRADWLRICAFAIAGVFFACGGLALLAQFQSGWPQAASGWEMNGIAASVLGGASLLGGTGIPMGAIPGAIVLALILRFLVVVGVNAYWQQVATGLFVVGVACALARGEHGR